jgi:hypothetical protein
MVIKISTKLIKVRLHFTKEMTLMMNGGSQPHGWHTPKVLIQSHGLQFAQ